jgi:hypothetical protein
MQQVIRAVPFILLLVLAVIAFMQGLAVSGASAIGTPLVYAIGSVLIPILVGLVCAGIGYLVNAARGRPHNFKQVWERCMGIAALLLIVGQLTPKH